MPVDFAGYPCDYDTIHAMVQEAGVRKLFLAQGETQKKLGRILVLADAAHSLGASAGSRKTAALADASVFSFHAVKNLVTAEGGAVALCLPAPFYNEEEYRSLCIKSLHGQNKDALAKLQKGNWRYDIVEAGYKCNMTDIAAAIGLVELERYDSDTLKKRKHIVSSYTEMLSKHSWAELPEYKSPEKESSYHLYPLRIKGINEEQRDEIIRKIFDKEVSVNVHFIPVPMMSFYRSLGYDIHNYPIAFDNYAREISLPVFYDLSDEQLKTVVEAVVESVESTVGPRRS